MIFSPRFAQFHRTLNRYQSSFQILNKNVGMKYVGFFVSFPLYFLTWLENGYREKSGNSQ